MEMGAINRGAPERRPGLAVTLIGVVLGLCLCLPASALAVDSSDGVAAEVFRARSEVDVYYRGADNGIWERVYSDATGWSSAFELPGTAGLAASSPAVDVFRNGA